MKTLPLLIIITLSLWSNGCSAVDSYKTVTASGPDRTENVKVQKITEITACQAIVVNYTIGEEVSVSYTVPESLVPYLQITCSNGKLKCQYQNGTNVMMNDRKVIVEVTAPNVSEFDASSGALIDVRGKLSVNTLEVEASSAASIQIDAVTSKTTEIESSSGGRISISTLDTKSADITSSSSAQVKISGSLGSVKANASSGGYIDFGGQCAEVDIVASSAGTVNASSAKITTGCLNATSGGSIKVSEATEGTYKTSKSSGGSISIL